MQLACAWVHLFLATSRLQRPTSNMASTANQQQPFPAVPPSLSAGDHEMRDYYAEQDAPRPALYQTPYLTPYLGLRARLSQVWINRWTILLLLVLVRLLFAIASTNDSLASARREALSACTQVENIGSSMASMPHFMSEGVNDMTATGVEKAVNGLMSVMDMSVTGVEEIVLFVIHMMTSTYLCLITLAVRGSLQAAVEVGNEISKGLNETVDAVTNDMGNAVKGVTDAINKIFDSINSLPFVPGFTKPNIDLTKQITQLKALEVPPELQEGLNKLNSSIPTFEDVQNFTDNVIRLPFEEVKKLIAGMGNFTFDRDLLPVPQKEQLDFCSEGNSINEFFDDLVIAGYTAKKIALGVLILAAILAMVPMTYAEYRRHKKQMQRTQLFEQGHDKMDVVYLVSRPHTSDWGMWLGKKFGSGNRQIAIRWAFAYATSLPMLFLLSLGIAGLLSCLCQYALVRTIQQKVPELTDQVADFAEKVVGSLNNASMSWADGVNGEINKMDDKINDEIFGWVNSTTSAINGTLNSFVSEMSKTLNDTFGGTVLKDPIQDVLNCLIGLKIASFQKGLTWVQDNAHVSFPNVKNDTFSIGALAKVSNSSSAAELLSDPNGKATDEITEAVDHVVNTLISGIRTEALISTVIICLWLLSALGGLIFAIVYMARAKPATNFDPYIINPVLHDNPHGEKPQETQEFSQGAAPPYEYPVNQAAPHAMTSQPFQPYGPHATAEPETVGHVGSHVVAEAARPGHLRTSSYGQVADPSPLDEKTNPFMHESEKPEKNPFADY